MARRATRARLVISWLAISALAGLSLGLPQPARAGLITVAINDTFTAIHDRPLVRAAPGVLANDVNLLGGSSAELVSGVARGTLTLRADGGFTYTPDAGYVGGDSFRYRISGLVSTPATVTITVTNSGPVANADAYATPSRTTLVVPAPGVLGNDTDANGDALVAELVAASGISGSLDLEPDGRLVYSPGGGASGTTSFSYRVWDGVAWSSPTTVSLTIANPTPTPAPTPPPTLAPTSTPQPTTAPTPPHTQSPVPSGAATARPTPRPTSGTPATVPGTATPRPTPSDAASAEPDPRRTPDPSGSSETPGASASGSTPSSSDGSGVGGGGATPSSPSTGGGGTTVPPLTLRLDDEGGVALASSSISLLAGLQTWAVPAATIAVPGLLVLLWVALQAIGALAWVPATRRLRGGTTPQKRGRAA